ncbi:MAG: hypothetical protein HN392_00735 [Anaerolineae bacterium]|jgi:hypothetical protein|nr:hypothetical protein [Anaerolineae bacterium]MBT7075503.1 hypothetical protein [Anaerolineae bacterium]MBT7783753.1 hypothetical protein [Anaerolineae bacterium]
MKKRLILILAVLFFASLACSIFTGPVSDDTPAPELAPENIEEPAAAPAPTIIIAEEPAVVDKTIRIDDFSDTNSGWPESATEGGHAYYESGEYHIEVNDTQLDLWAHPGWNMPNDLSIEVDATKVSGTDDNDYGIICRYNDNDTSTDYYFFIISSDGFAGIGLSLGDDTSIISGESMEETAEIIQGNAKNHIRADCVGSHLALYINGVQVAFANDSTLSSGDVGLMAGTFDIPDVNIMFDNFVVSTP